MRLKAVIIKSLKENIRDWKVLVLALAFSPFFILLMKLLYGCSAVSYKAAILNYDRGVYSAELKSDINKLKAKDNSNMFLITSVKDKNHIISQIKDKTIDIGIIIPKDYSKKLISRKYGNNNNHAVINFYGSMGNINYTVAAVFISDVIHKQGMKTAGITLPSEIKETFLEKTRELNEFSSYVPGLLSLSVLMILFTTCASIVKENEKNTLMRLKLSKLGAFNFLFGVSIVQAAVSVAGLIVAYYTAIGLGYESAGSFITVLMVGILSSLSMVAVSLVAVSFLNTVFDVLTVGCFPFFILMFFSGSMFPVPKINLFSIGGHPFGLTDVLPLTHTADAFNKILNYGSGIKGVAFQLFMIVILTIIYFIIGLVLYQKRKLNKA